ncbi:MAG: hypothetical protein HDQ90_09800 [Desulfovibrio sp.]|nr:hypothetical protein [Desulfovibrio sp.]
MKKLFLLLATGALFLSLAGGASAAGSLDARRAAIIPIAAHTASGDQEALALALEEGLDSGLERNAIKEILLQMYAYCGFPRSLDGLNTFMAVVEKRRQAGKEDAEGEAPRALPAVNQLRAHLGFALNTGLTPEQLDEAVVILTEKGGEAPGMLARAALKQVLAGREKKAPK